MTLKGKPVQKQEPGTVGQVFEHFDCSTLAFEAGAPT